MATGVTNVTGQAASLDNQDSFALRALRGLLGADKTQGPGEVYDEAKTPHPTTYRFTAQGQALTPEARVLPTSPEDVATILKYCKDSKTHFAVKSGGHGTYATASSCDSVVIDLSKLNHVKISTDKTSVSVGSGARWGAVYRTLEQERLACVGGRVTGVGVGGLLLGGGISFFSSQRGLGCDNICSYKVVLASGDIVKVTRDSYSDLYWALRGAGTNMCIVVEFELNLFEQGKIWGGVKVVPSVPNDELLPSLHKFCKDSADLSAEVFVTTGYMAEHESYVSTIVFTYSKPQPQPAVFAPFKALPEIFTNLRIATLAEIADDLEAANPSGLRFKSKTVSVKSDAALLEEVNRIFKDEIDPIKSLPGLNPVILFQPLTPAMLPTDDIGNTLGIKHDDGPIHIISLLVSWTRVFDDARIINAIDNVMNRIVGASTAKKLFHPYIYLNYAAAEQDVYGSYGDINKERLLQISKKYDPEQVFDVLRPGYIHLTGPRGGNKSY